MLEYPLQPLEMAIESLSERRACKALASRHVRGELRCSTTEHNVPRSPEQRKFDVFTCVESAVRCGMPGIVLAMEQVNPEDVRMATWYALYKLQTGTQSKSKHSTATTLLHVPSALTALADAQRKMWLWERVGVLVLARHMGSSDSGKCERRPHGIATLPDAVFQVILSFVELPERKEAQIRRFLLEARPCRTCFRLCIPGNCKAKRMRRLERRAVQPAKRSAGSTHR